MTEEIVMGTKMFSHVFFVLLSYTNNLKLTIFLAERAILLYTEFIIMSNDKQVMKDVCYQPTMTDPILFAYKKTIGPIPVNITENTPEFNLLKSSSLLMREVYIRYYELFFDNTENHLDNLDTIEETLSSRLLEVFSQIYTQENMNNLVSKKEVVNVLNISKGKLDSMIRENEIPYIRLGKVIRFDMSDVVKSIKR